MSITDLAPGADFRVLGVAAGGEIGKRLADLGFTEGALGTLVRGASMGGPLQVRIRGYDLLLRRGEAARIAVAPITAPSGNERKAT